MSSPERRAVTGGRRGAVVLGSPIAHSLSPALHNAAYAELGLTGWSYRAEECDEAGLSSLLQRLDVEGLAGASLTMPLKRAVLPLLARTDRVAADVGAANTVLFGGVSGEWWGANTDVPGLVDVLRGAGVGVPPLASVLGAGATAASTVAALADVGVPSIVVWARRPEQAGELGRVAHARGATLEVRMWPVPGAQASWVAPMVVSTVPAGAADALATEIAGSDLGDSLLVDVVYAPWPTALAVAWEAAGGRALGGLELLVAQAAHQVRLMTGLEAPVAAMREAGRQALSAR